MSRNVVRLGSQGLSVPVFSFSQLVQSYVGLSCESRTRVESGGVKLSKVKTSHIFPLFNWGFPWQWDGTSVQWGMESGHGIITSYIWHWTERMETLRALHWYFRNNKSYFWCLSQQQTCDTEWVMALYDIGRIFIFFFLKENILQFWTIGEHYWASLICQTSPDTSSSASPDPPPAHTWTNNNSSFVAIR